MSSHKKKISFTAPLFHEYQSLENAALWLVEKIFGQYFKIKNFADVYIYICIYIWGGFSIRKQNFHLKSSLTNLNKKSFQET